MPQANPNSAVSSSLPKVSGRQTGLVSGPQSWLMFRRWMFANDKHEANQTPRGGSAAAGATPGQRLRSGSPPAVATWGRRLRGGSSAAAGRGGGLKGLGP
jgi:hypothetical protein